MQTDAELLAAYLAGDNDAFAALVHRHAEMVFGVCTRVLRSRHDAEDTFQATFLILARKAADVRPAGHVARWLYGVARRVALKARHRRERRRSIEALAGEAIRATEPTTGLPDNMWSVLDEEVARLPGRLLSPFVLCDLEGMTYRDAARELGVPEGTLSNRLAAARRQLAVWLTRRGIVFPATGLAVALAPSDADAASPELIETAAEMASSVDALSPLAKGVIRSMAIIKVARASTALVVAIGLTYGGWAVLSARVEDKEAKALDGEWTVARAEKGGKQLPADDVKKMKVTIKDGTMTIDAGGRQETVAVAGIDPTARPKGIDFRPLKLNNGQVDRGIFELVDDELKLCWGGETKPGGRPEEFKTTKEGGGRLLVLKRKKAKG